VDIESIIKYKLPSVQSDVRLKAQKVIDKLPPNQFSEKANNELKATKSLKEKDVVYLKADKSNNVVVLNKCDYENRVRALINECKYKEIKKSPLKTMIREANSLRQKIKTVFSERTSRSLIVSNPTLSKLYALPKTHKPGNKMRPIVSNINAPTYKIAKWLVKELKEVPNIKSMSVKNSFEFVDKIKDLRIESDETLVSFDVCSLFPSIPVEKAINVLERHLQKEVGGEKSAIYIEAAKLCMKQNYFQFREKVYKVEFGTNMGNPLSPLIAETFMADFEMRLKEEGLLPRFWVRYVDDVCAVVKKDDVQKVLDVLNNRENSINFTFELENDKKLPFLDLMLRRVENYIEVSIYHKPTSTMRTITNDSHSPIQHKVAAYHSMVHRLCRMPLSVASFKEEYEYIKSTAAINGKIL